MKHQIILLLIICCSTIQVHGQKEIVGTKLTDLKKEYDLKLSSYKTEKDKLEDKKNITNTAFDTNAQKVVVSKLYSDIYTLCKRAKALKETFKDVVSSPDAEAAFPAALEKGFVDEVRPVETSFVNDNLTYLNAYNFDFNNSNAASGYMGNLNLFFVLNKKSAEPGWAINAGLRKINYAFADTKYTAYEKENILIKPLDEVMNVNDKYLKEFNKYETTSKIGSWSAYFQVLHRIARHSIQSLYIHVHTELQISKVDFKTEKFNIQSDTVTVTAANVDKIPPLQTGLERNLNINNTYFGYYFAPGLTGDFNIIEADGYKLRYFMQESIGYCNLQLGNSKSLFTDENYYNNNVNFMGNFFSGKHFFHLLNSYVSNQINGLNIIVGTEIRGVFDAPPLYIFYVGVNTDLQKIGGLFK